MGLGVGWMGRSLLSWHEVKSVWWGLFQMCQTCLSRIIRYEEFVKLLLVHRMDTLLHT